MHGSEPDQGPLEEPLDPSVTEFSVTGPTRREACGSICRLLLEDMVKTQAGSSKWARQESNQVNGRGLRSANNIQRARQRDDPGNKQKVRNQTTRQHRRTRQKL